MIHLAFALAGALLLLLAAFYALLFALWLAVQVVALLAWPIRAVLEYRHNRRPRHKPLP